MLLNHYKMYLLDKTSLTNPYKREEIERVGLPIYLHKI